MMTDMTPTEFRNLKEKDGKIFFFNRGDACSLCGEYETQVQKFGLGNLVKVTANSDNELIDLGLLFVPTTQMYKNGEIAYQKGGVLFHKQLTELKEEFINLFGDWD